MTHQERKIKIQQQLNFLYLEQLNFAEKVKKLNEELSQLMVFQEKEAEKPIPQELKKWEPKATKVETIILPKIEEKTSLPIAKKTPEPIKSSIPPIKKNIPTEPEKPFNLEQFIGGNLLNKVGIIILLLGIGLFVKFTIDKGLFPPTIRVLMGYLSGLVLVGFAYRFKIKYETYSAVLFSGGMAVLYFTSYLGYSFFETPILTQVFAFILMVIFMGISVAVASKYNHQVIGLLGLVGAYAIPFLLSDGSGNYLVLLTYMTILNVGVLILAAKKGWQKMTSTAFILSWIIFLSWIIGEFNPSKHLAIAWIFTLLQFQIFYTALVAFQLKNGSKFSPLTIFLIIVNGVLFYLLTHYLALTSKGDHLLGLISFANAIIHFGVSYLFYRRMENKSPFLLLSILGTIYLTLAISIEFSVKTIIILWALEALVLLRTAFNFKIKTYKVLSLTILVLSVFVLIFNWNSVYYETGEIFTPFLNFHFFTSITIIGIICLYTNSYYKKSGAQLNNDLFYSLCFAIVGLTYFAFFNEIIHGFSSAIKFSSSQISSKEQMLRSMLNISLFNFTFLFIAALGVLNFKKIKSEALAIFFTIISLGLVSFFCIQGIPELNKLRAIYIEDSSNFSFFLILIRYLSYATIAFLLYVLQKQLKLIPNNIETLRKALPLVFHFLILLALSTELITWFDLGTGSNFNQIAMREGFSILWGLYSFVLIGLGIRQQSQMLRIAGIGLFTFTLGKIFLFDLVNLTIISRTILFIAIGALMLVTSYLYQRFKDVIK